AGRGHRRRKQITLRLIAAEVGEQVPGRPLLDALSDGGHAELAREADRGVDDQGVAVVLAKRGNELAVDLQRVRREALEVGQRRVAGAEIVDRDLDTEGL